MRYAYEDLSDDQYERLVILLCQQLFGIAMQGFTSGPDGGRDGRYDGDAALFPSKGSPWRGRTIVQAKHTKGMNRSFSDTDFYNPDAKSSVLSIEVPRIRALRKAGVLDHYILFSNRRLPGRKVEEIISYISMECDIPHASIYLCDVEQMELWLCRFPEVADLANLDPIDSPLIVSSQELAEVVEAFAPHHQASRLAVETTPKDRVSFSRKNDINAMTPEYAEMIRKRFLKDSMQIQEFLAAPENLDILKIYEVTTMEFQAKIIAKRKAHQSFDEIMEYLIDLLFSRDAVLRQAKHKRITRAMLFHMYWSCDIGMTDDVAA